MSQFSIMQHVLGRAWAIDASLAEHFRGLVSRDGIAALRDLAAIKATVHGYDESSVPMVQLYDVDAKPLAAGYGGGASRRGNQAVVSVVRLRGVMTQHGDVVGSDKTASTDAFAAEIERQVADPQVDAVVMAFDAPGGEVFGVAEAAARIRAAAKSKPVLSAADSYAASAAFWLFAQGSEAYVTPGGQVGSHGVYAMHADESKALEAEGVKITFISAGKYKVEGNQTEPLTEEARGSIQSYVDRYYNMFTADLAKGRGVSVEQVRTGFGEGRMVGADAAVAAGMADGKATLAEVIRRAAALVTGRRPAGVDAAAALLG